MIECISSLINSFNCFSNNNSKDLQRPIIAHKKEEKENIVHKEEENTVTVNDQNNQTNTWIFNEKKQTWSKNNVKRLDPKKVIDYWSIAMPYQTL